MPGSETGTRPVGYFSQFLCVDLQDGTGVARLNFMPRPRMILQCDYPYHVSGRCINGEWFKLPIEVVWKIFCRQLTYMSWVFDAKIHSFVLMENHYHLMLTTPQANLSELMGNFMRETTRQLNLAAGRINQAWGSRHFRSVIASDHYYLHAYKYIYSNPVAAGLAQRCEDYLYSSLRFLLGMGTVEFPVAEDETLFSDLEGTLSWLNRKPDDDDWLQVSWAMKQSQFRLPKRKDNKKPSQLEYDIL